MHMRPFVRWLVLCGVVGAVALVCAVLAGRFLRRERLFLQAPSATVGVVAADPPPDARVVLYRFQAGGQWWAGSFRPNRLWTAHRAGDALPVYYLSADPSVNSATRPTPGDLERVTTVAVLFGGFVVVLTGLIAHRGLTEPGRVAVSRPPGLRGLVGGVKSVLAAARNPPL